MVDLVEADELSPKTVNNARTYLSMAFGEAVRRGLLPRNPCDGVPALPVERAEVEFRQTYQSQVLFDPHIVMEISSSTALPTNVLGQMVAQVLPDSRLNGKSDGHADAAQARARAGVACQAAQARSNGSASARPVSSNTR